MRKFDKFVVGLLVFGLLTINFLSAASAATGSQVVQMIVAGEENQFSDTLPLIPGSVKQWCANFFDHLKTHELMPDIVDGMFVVRFKESASFFTWQQARPAMKTTD